MTPENWVYLNTLTYPNYGWNRYSSQPVWNNNSFSGYNFNLNSVYQLPSINSGNTIGLYDSMNWGMYNAPNMEYWNSYGLYNPMNYNFNSYSNGYNNEQSQGSTTFTSTSATSSKTNDADAVKISSAQREKLKEEQKNQLAKANRAAHGGLGAALLGSAVFATPAIVKGAHIQRNQPVTNMFFTSNTAKLWETHPTTMTEAQKVMQKIEKQYVKERTKLAKKFSGESLRKALSKLDENYKVYISKMEKTLEHGTAEQVAKITQRYKTSNGKWYKKTPDLAKKVENWSATRSSAKAAKAVAGNSFLRHMGGGMGMGIGLLVGGFTYLSGDEKAKRQEAKMISEKTGDKSVYRKQVTQSVMKSFIPMVGWTLGDAGGKWLVHKFVSKNAGKIANKTFATKLSGWFTKKATTKLIGKTCGKIAGKLTGKAIGAAIGSFIPGLGTIAGLAIGAAVDWALRKYVVPAIFGENDVIDEKKIEQAPDADLLANAYISKLSGEKISAEAEAAIASNPTFCARLHEQILAEQQAQGTYA